MKKKLAFVLALVYAITVVLCGNAFADSRKEYNDQLNLVEIGDSTETGFSWNPEDKILTLTNVEITYTAADAIKLPDNAKIVVNGDCLIKTGDDFTCITGKNIVITGTGSLALDGERGIKCDSLTVELGEFKAIAKEYVVKAKDDVSITADTVEMSNNNYIPTVSTENGNVKISSDSINIANAKGSAYEIAVEAEDKYVELDGKIEENVSLNVDGNVIVAEGKTLENNGEINVGENNTITADDSTKITGTGTTNVEPIFKNGTVYVNGTDILKAENMTVECGEGTAKYDAETGVLTFENAVITDGCAIADGEEAPTAGIYIMLPITIKLVGDSEISGVTYGIYADGKSISIVGNGTLTVSGDEAAVIATGEDVEITWATGLLDNKYSVESIADEMVTYSAIAEAELQFGEEGVLEGAAKEIVFKSTLKIEELAAIPGGFVGQEIEYSLNGEESCVSGGAGEYTFTAENLPAGLEISDDGVISGKIEKAIPTTTVTVTVTDKDGNTAEAELIIGNFVGVEFDEETKAAVVTFAAETDEETGDAVIPEEVIDVANAILEEQEAESCDVVIVCADESASLEITAGKLIANEEISIESLAIELENAKVKLDKEKLDALLNGEEAPNDVVITVKKLAFDDLTEEQATNLGENEEVNIYELKVSVNGEESEEFDAEFIVPVEIDTEAKYYFKNLDTDENIEVKYDGIEKMFVIEVEAGGVYAVIIENGPKPNPDPDPIPKPDWENPFNDVNEKSWFYESVKFVSENNLMNGVATNQFAPNTTTSRAMFVTVLYRYSGSPEVTQEERDACALKDIYKTNGNATWYTDAVIWAAANGYVNGTSPTTFAPNEKITREQMVTIMYRFAKGIGKDVSVGEQTLDEFADKNNVSGFAVNALKWAVKNGIVNGATSQEGLKVNAKSAATRSQMAAIFERFVKNV